MYELLAIPFKKIGKAIKMKINIWKEPNLISRSKTSSKSKEVIVRVLFKQ